LDLADMPIRGAGTRACRARIHPGGSARPRILFRAHPGAKILMAKLHSTVQRIDNDSRNGLQPKVEGAAAGCIQIAIHPDKGLSIPQFFRRRVAPLRKTPVQMPGYEEPFALRVLMRKSVSGKADGWKVGPLSISSQIIRRDKSRRGRQECLRHNL
jgi:hypothetical protein